MIHHNSHLMVFRSIFQLQIHVHQHTLLFNGVPYIFCTYLSFIQLRHQKTLFFVQVLNIRNKSCCSTSPRSEGCRWCGRWSMFWWFWWKWRWRNTFSCQYIAWKIKQKVGKENGKIVEIFLLWMHVNNWYTMHTFRKQQVQTMNLLLKLQYLCFMLFNDILQGSYKTITVSNLGGQGLF